MHSCPFVVQKNRSSSLSPVVAHAKPDQSEADAVTEVDGGALAFLWLVQALWGRCPHLQGRLVRVRWVDAATCRLLRCIGFFGGEGEGLLGEGEIKCGFASAVAQTIPQLGSSRRR